MYKKAETAFKELIEKLMQGTFCFPTTTWQIKAMTALMQKFLMMQS